MPINLEDLNHSTQATLLKQDKTDSLFSVLFYKLFFWYVLLLFFSYLALSYYMKRLFYPFDCFLEYCHTLKSDHFTLPNCPDTPQSRQLSNGIHHLIQVTQELCVKKQDIYREAAHELKSPIAILKARLSLFKQDPTASKEEFVNKSLEDIQNITQKLKEMLFLKEIEWEMSQKKQPFRIKSECEMLYHSFIPILKRKNLSIIYTNDEDFELSLHKNAIGKVLQAVFENIFYHAKTDSQIKITIDATQKALTMVNDIGQKSDAALFSSSLGEKIIQRLSVTLKYTYTTHQDDRHYTTIITFYE